MSAADTIPKPLPTKVLIHKNALVTVGSAQFTVHAGSIIEDPIVIAYVVAHGSVVFTEVA